ncbi:oxidoreductase [Sphingobium sp. WCS2017Hpa-17]|uniref:oxidoreductase n=1 Tax=Sphingobium sp. WCS2017Hpa-17 TaxID=3073638 RepID=UPI0028897767|nr:oxidoreductase [Sphingobium sp. WCS2017Hpa-17]
MCMEQPPVWFVTGASAGFGRALVREIMARGDRVVAAARRPEDVADLVARAPDRCMAVQLDVTSGAAIDAAVTAAFDRFGAIDMLVNNAGYGFLSTIEEAEAQAVERQFATNVLGPAALMRAVLPGMRARRSGFVVNISSTAGARGFAGSGYYSASKAALEAMTEALAAEARDLGIRAMIVCPGPFRTDFFGRSIDLPDTEITDYTATLTQRRAYAAADGTQKGDPARGAKIIIDTVLGDAPPLRLVLGAQALPTIVAAHEAKIADLQWSETVAPLADFPEGE